MQNVISLDIMHHTFATQDWKTLLFNAAKFACLQLPGLFLVCKVLVTGEYSTESLKGEFGVSINSELAERPVLGLGKFIQKEGARKVTMGIIVVLMNFSCKW